MGLDTSHDCWHGSYSAFSCYRRDLVRLAWDSNELKGNIYNYEGFRDPNSHHASEITSSEPIPYPQDDALVTLIHHSDCNGEIAPELCGPLADRLEQLMEKMAESSILFTLTRNWVRGLRLAAASNEAVKFE